MLSKYQCLTDRIVEKDREPYIKDWEFYSESEKPLRNRVVTILNGFQPSTIYIKTSIFDVTWVLDPLRLAEVSHF